MKTYYIVQGKMTCPDSAEAMGGKVGDSEFQFSDGPAGARSVSYDFPSIAAGIEALGPAVFIMESST